MVEWSTVITALTSGGLTLLGVGLGHFLAFKREKKKPLLNTRAEVYSEMLDTLGRVWSVTPSTDAEQKELNQTLTSCFMRMLTIASPSTIQRLNAMRSHAVLNPDDESWDDFVAVVDSMREDLFGSEYQSVSESAAQILVPSQGSDQP